MMQRPEGSSASSFPGSARCGHAVEIADLVALDAFAAKLAARAQQSDVFALSGELGAGKTTLVRAVLAALACREGVAPPAEVPSPTFTLVQSYDIGSFAVSHFDLYRLKTPDEALELGIEDAVADGIALIEWPDRLGPYLPRDRIAVDLAIEEEGRRRAEVRAFGRAAARHPELFA
jgi:tRNA threonylcarbamoyladenosine biosynthesis protein TsaE